MEGVMVHIARVGRKFDIATIENGNKIMSVTHS